MLRRFESVVSGLVAIAAVAIAAALVHREFFAKPEPRTISIERGPPTFLDNWEEIVPNGIVLGSASAMVKIVEFADLECPFCARFHRVIKDVLQAYPDSVALVFVHLPLKSIHRFANPAALAAECAAAEGRFSAFIDAVFEKQDSLGLKNWSGFAREAGIRDTANFERCRATLKKHARVDAGMALAEKLNITGTPTVIVNGWRFPTAPVDSQLRNVIRNLLDGRSAFESQRAGQ